MGVYATKPEWVKPHIPKTLYQQHIPNHWFQDLVPSLRRCQPAYAAAILSLAAPDRFRTRDYIKRLAKRHAESL